MHIANLVRPQIQVSQGCEVAIGKECRTLIPNLVTPQIQGSQVRKLKTSGFHWENTHMKQSGRLVSLLIILAFGLLMASFTGRDQKIPWKKTPGCPLYSVFKQGLISLQFLFAQSLALAIETIQNILERVQNAGF